MLSSSHSTETEDVEALGQAIAKCKICQLEPLAKPLPHSPRPVAVLSSTAKIRIIGQAPGARVHASGRPFTDPSGDRLRDWLGLDEDQFYDASRLAITPMGFCFPGNDDKGGDLPPRKECRLAWQERITNAMPQVELVLLVGLYAQRHYLGARAGKSLTDTVRNWEHITKSSSDPIVVPLPHPSWRNNAWVKKNAWFSNDLLPYLRKLIQFYY